MSEKITTTLAANLAYFMELKEVTQQQLAGKSGLGQTTISLYLNPTARKVSATGKDPSPTIARIDALAGALGVELWELLRPLTPAQRDLVRSVEAVIAERTAATKTTPAEPPTVPRARRSRASLLEKRRKTGT